MGDSMVLPLVLYRKESTMRRFAHFVARAAVVGGTKAW
jgi:hypothetical protein